MGRPKYTITTEVRNFIEYQLSYYPENRKQLETIKADMIPSSIPKYGPQTGGFNPEQRPTEDTAVKIVSDIYILQLEHTVNAISSVLEKLGKEDMELIRLKYWSGELTPEGIALKLNIGIATFYRRLNTILTQIGIRLGYINLVIKK